MGRGRASQERRPPSWLEDRREGHGGLQEKESEEERFLERLQSSGRVSGKEKWDPEKKIPSIAFRFLAVKGFSRRGFG